jgi:hypothetical protein
VSSRQFRAPLHRPLVEANIHTTYAAINKKDEKPILKKQ